MNQESNNLRKRESIAFLAFCDGCRLRYGTWRSSSANVRGTILILGGRAEFIEKYYEIIGELIARGWHVYTFDWRGQGLSECIAADGNANGLSIYNRYLHDLDRILHHVVYPDQHEPLIVLAHSMGGHILLRYLNEQRHRISGAIITAPMIGIYTYPLPIVFARWLTWTMVRRGYGNRTIPAAHYHNPLTVSFKRNRLTSDWERFVRTRRWVEQNPLLSKANLTFGWLGATFDSMNIVNRSEFGVDIRIPIMTILAGSDRVVRNQAAALLSKRLPNHILTRIESSRHEILQERDDIQVRFWRLFESFTKALEIS